MCSCDFGRVLRAALSAASCRGATGVAAVHVRGQAERGAAAGAAAVAERAAGRPVWRAERAAAAAPHQRPRPPPGGASEHFFSHLCFLFFPIYVNGTDRGMFYVPEDLICSACHVVHCQGSTLLIVLVTALATYTRFPDAQDGIQSRRYCL